MGIASRIRRFQMELDLEKEKRKLQVDIEVEQYRRARFKDIENLALQCASDRGQYEHTYHHKMEELGIEIAKLEALKETMKNDVTVLERIIKGKDEEIKRLHEVCMKMAESQKIVIHK